MSNVDALTTTEWVTPNEPCYLIYEINRPVPLPGEGLHRFRYILVGRNDKLAQHVEDLGRATNFPEATEMQIKTGGVEDDGKAWSEHTVAEAIDMIESARIPRFDIEDVPRMGDLEEGYQSVIEQRKRPENRKVFTNDN